MGKAPPSTNLPRKAPGVPRHRSPWAGFTLIELVVVIGIMALLMAIVMPVFSGMAGAQGVKAGSRVLIQKLKLARAFAIDNHERVAVLMPKFNDLSSLSATARPKYENHAYRACLVEYDSTSSRYNFKKWINGENWDFLPDGIIIADIDSTSDDQTGSSSTASFAAAETVYGVKCEGIGCSGTVDMPAIVFTPIGKCTKDAYVVLANDTLDSNGARIKGADTSSPNREKDLNIKVDMFTGRVTFEE